jgi:plastocyanin
MKTNTFLIGSVIFLLVLGAGTAVLARGSYCHGSGDQSSMMHEAHGDHHRGNGMMGWMHQLHNNLSGWWDTDRGSTSNVARDNDNGTGSATDTGKEASDTVITLRTSSNNGMSFSGVSEEVKDQVNPTIHVNRGETVRLRLINSSGVHDIAIPAFNVQSAKLTRRGTRTTIQFSSEKTGEYVYFCTIPGHRSAGMEGTIIVE